MRGVSVSSKGDFSDTKRWLKSLSNMEYMEVLEYYGQKGVYALSAATPVDTGKTAASWSYEIEVNDDIARICWTNSSLADDGETPIAVLLQYGHGTATGGYVPPNDFINPTIAPIFDDITETVWRVVTQR